MQRKGHRPHRLLPYAFNSFFPLSPTDPPPPTTALGQPQGPNLSPVLTDPVTKRLAQKYGKPEGTVLLSWAVQRGWTAVPKTVNPQRMRDNFDVSVSLPSGDFFFQFDG